MLVNKCLLPIHKEKYRNWEKVLKNFSVNLNNFISEKYNIKNVGLYLTFYNFYFSKKMILILFYETNDPWLIVGEITFPSSLVVW